MSEKFLPFALPKIGEEEIKEVCDCLRSGWITTGPRAIQLEKDFSDFLKKTFCLAVNSATSGLHLALRCLNLKAGDQVLVPVNTFTATAEVVRWFQADPVFIDIEWDSMNIDPQEIQKWLETHDTTKVKAIIPVHFGGVAAKMNKILEIAKKWDLKVIEDAAHALPTTFEGKLVGTLDSDFTVFSFYATKTITTAEGGMLVCKREEDFQLAKKLRLHGISKDVWNRYHSENADWFYDVEEAGFKYNLPDILAAIGIHQLKKIYSFHQKRESIVRFYHQNLHADDLILPLISDTEIYSHHLFCLRLPAKISRNHFFEQMKKSQIGVSVHFIPLHMMSYWKNLYHHNDGDFPVAYRSFQRSLSLPVYPKMTETDTKRVCSVFNRLISDLS